MPVRWLCFHANERICHFRLDFTLSFLMWLWWLLGINVNTPASVFHTLRVSVCAWVSLVYYTHQTLLCCSSSGLAFQQEIKDQGFAFASRFMELNSYSSLDLIHTNVLTSRNTFPWSQTYVDIFKQYTILCDWCRNTSTWMSQLSVVGVTVITADFGLKTLIWTKWLQ